MFFTHISAFAQTMNVSYKSFSEKDTVMKYNISAEFPQVDFGPDALMGVRGIAEDINNLLDTIIENKIINFRNDVKQTVNNAEMNDQESSLGITSSAEVISSTFLSAQIKKFSFVKGMAHPDTYIQSFNYSIVSTGYLQSLSDLFKPDADYLKYISGYCINELKTNAVKQGYTNIDDMINERASPDIKNFNVWNISVDSLIITFNPYTVAPYVFGIQTVSISLANMTEMIDPKGPLAFMFR